MKDLNQRPVPAAITQLRAEIEALPRRPGGGRQSVPEALRRRVAVLFKQSGMTVPEFASATTLGKSSIWRWSHRPQKAGKPLPRSEIKSRLKRSPTTGGAFKKVRVLEESSPAASSIGLRLEGPGGMRISGLGVEDVARLWKALC